MHGESLLKEVVLYHCMFDDNDSILNKVLAYFEVVSELQSAIDTFFQKCAFSYTSVDV